MTCNADPRHLHSKQLYVVDQKIVSVIKCELGYPVWGARLTIKLPYYLSLTVATLDVTGF